MFLPKHQVKAMTLKTMMNDKLANYSFKEFLARQ